MVAIICTAFCHCATDKELQERAISRYVKDDVYRNKLKGFQMNWPSRRIWNYQNYPEFDLTFDHFEGRAQMFVIGIKPLVRRSFPDGFVEWLLDRLQAKEYKVTTQEEISHDPVQQIQINLAAKFSVLPRENFGVDRLVSIFVFNNNDRWIGVIYLAPKDSFETYLPNVKTVVDSISFLAD